MDNAQATKLTKALTDINKTLRDQNSLMVQIAKMQMEHYDAILRENREEPRTQNTTVVNERNPYPND